MCVFTRVALCGATCASFFSITVSSDFFYLRRSRSAASSFLSVYSLLSQDRLVLDDQLFFFNVHVLLFSVGREVTLCFGYGRAGITIHPILARCCILLNRFLTGLHIQWVILTQ